MTSSRYSRWWSSRSNKKAKPGETKSSVSIKPDTKNIEALLSAVNSSSQHVRNFYITFLLAGIYIAIIIWSTTDMMLLKETPVNLPLLNAELPITGFYRFAPYFYLFVHFNLLLQLCLLSDKLHAYNAALLKLEDNELGKYYDTRLFPFAFSHTLSGAQHSRILKLLLTAMVWITMIWLPLCLLIGLQVGFLAYHSEQVLALQRWAIIADLGILTLFWPIIRSPDGKWIIWILRATGVSSLLSWINRRLSKTTVIRQQGFVHALIQRFNSRTSGIPMFEGSLSLVTLMAVIGFSWGVAVLPDSDNEQWVANKVLIVAQWLDRQSDNIMGLDASNKQDKHSTSFVNAFLSEELPYKEGERYFGLTEYLFERIYQKGDSGIKQAQNSIFHRNLKLREKLLIANELKPEDVALLRNNANKLPEDVLKKIVGMNLRGRDLRYANFSESLMPKVDFREINGVNARLNYANFDSAKLFEARMNKIQLQGASLSRAQLQGVNLRNAQLQDTDFFDTRLQGANLGYAQLQGANLRYAQLQGANLGYAKLQGVGLNHAQLQGVDFDHTQLQGAYLSHAQLQGADLSYTHFQGANLYGTRLQGANLEQANLTLSYISEAKFGRISEQYTDKLLENLTSSIKNPKRLKKIKDSLIKGTKESATLAKAIGQSIWIERLDVTVQLAILESKIVESKGGLALAKTESDYQNDLTEFLIKLSCQDKWIASGIIRERIIGTLFETSFSQCLLSLKNKKNKSGHAFCPGLSETSTALPIEFLKLVALKKVPKNIQATFKCEPVFENGSSEQDKIVELLEGL